MDNDTNPAHRLYRRLMGAHPGEGTRKFIKDLSWIGASFALAKAISSLVNIAAARMLGPLEYGRISVLVAAGSLLTPFLVAGWNFSIMRYGADKKIRDQVFGAAGAVFLTAAVAMAAVVPLFRDHIAPLLGITPDMLLLALAYAAASGAFVLVSSAQQCLGNFSERGAGEIIFSVLLAACFFLLLRYAGASYKAMAFAYTAAFGGVTVFWLIRLAGKVRIALPGRALFLEMTEHGMYYFGSALGAFLTMNVQSLVLNSFLTAREVGIYAAYNISTIGISGYLGYSVSAVLFPKAANAEDKRFIWDLGVRVWRYLAPAGVLLFFLSETAVLTLMGRHQYVMDFTLMALFAVCGTLMLVYTSLAQIIFSDGLRASRLALMIMLGTGSLNFIACILLIPRFRLAGAAVSMILTYGAALLWLWRTKEPHLRGASAGLTPDRGPA